MRWWVDPCARQIAFLVARGLRVILVMLDVSRRLFEIAVRQFAAGQLNVGDLTSGLHSVVSPSRFIDWNDLATLFERAEEAAGGGTRLTEISGAAAVQALPEGTALMSIAPDVLLGARLINHLADATFFANVRYPRMRQTGEHTLRLSLRLDRARGQRDSPAFLRAMEGTLRASSEFAGLSTATVKAQIRPFSAEYQVTLPKPAGAAAVDPAERAVKTNFLRQCAQALREARRNMVDLREAEIRARDAETFVALSSVVARALEGRERNLFPQAAVQAIQHAFGCQRVLIRRLSQAGKTRSTVLAAIGTPTRNLHVVETETSGGVLRIEADVARESPAARALGRLAPWLAIVCAEPPQAPEQTAISTSNWAELRLETLAGRWGLTPRQQQVAWLVLSGESNKGIASALRCTEGTVELHIHALLTKSGSGSRTALMARFFRGQ